MIVIKVEPEGVVEEVGGSNRLPMTDKLFLARGGVAGGWTEVIITNEIN